MDVVSDMSALMNNEYHKNEYFELNDSSVITVLLSDEMFYYLMDLINLTTSISELCDTSFTKNQ